MRNSFIVAITLTLVFATPCSGREKIERFTKEKPPPTPSKLYEDTLRLPDDAYLRWPLPAGEEAYAGIDGMAMKSQISEITAISRKSRDAGNQFWGRIAVTADDRMIQDWVVQQFKALGLERVRRQELEMSPLWYPNS